MNEIVKLLESARNGDRQAEEALVEAIQDQVYFHCRKILKREEDAEDAAQEVLISVLSGLNSLREPNAFWGWVNSITVNQCRRSFRGTTEWQIPEDEDGGSLLDDLEDLDEQAVPDKALDNEETRRMILELVDALPPGRGGLRHGSGDGPGHGPKSPGGPGDGGRRGRGRRFRYRRRHERVRERGGVPRQGDPPACCWAPPPRGP